MKIGAYPLGDGDCSFRVWAPLRKKVELRLPGPHERTLAMDPEEGGYWSVIARGVAPGDRYLFRLDGEIERPDPASFSQPDGVHGPSAVFDHAGFHWSDSEWRGVALDDLVSYELHVGTFTPEGTFAAAASRLRELSALGLTALEIMPVAQFPGERNWGYDGAYPFAVQNSYGGPDELKMLVDACHRCGLAVVLDVVYNHFGPEGSYVGDFAPYFTDRHRTPWGSAVNFDGPWSDGVRDFFVSNALYWHEHFHIDALRLDAVHAIHDGSARPFLRELARRVEEERGGQGRPLLIAESNLNEPRLTLAFAEGGYGLDCQWSDDFHHALRVLLTGEREGYYEDYGSLEQFAKTWREGFAYTGEYSRFRRKRHGSPAGDQEGHRFQVFSQNHDQVGNRMHGERLSSLVSFESHKLAAGATLLSPFLPLLFMGEEYGEEAPFLYFADHSDQALREAVRRGRREEFKEFLSRGAPPDPFSLQTFERSKIRWECRLTGRHRVLRDFYAELLRLRSSLASLPGFDRRKMEIVFDEGQGLLWVKRVSAGGDTLLVLCFAVEDAEATQAPFAGDWRLLLDSSDTRWDGPGSGLPKRVEGQARLRLRRRSLSLFAGPRGGEGR
jgi:maltooligosyltrehalose trehalohydrolase